MAFDLQGARAAGYTDDEIADYLGQQSRFDVGAARKAGYSAVEILDFLAKPSSPAVPAPSAGVAPDAEIDQLAMAQAGQDAAAGRVTDTPRRESVLEGEFLPEQPFDSIEATRLSRRDYAEATDPARRLPPGPSMRPGPKDSVRASGEDTLGRAGDLIASQAYSAAAGLGRMAATGAESLGADGIAENIDARAAAASDRSRRLQQGVELERVARGTGMVEGFAPGSVVQDTKRFADEYLPQILAQSPQLPMAIFGGLTPLVGISYLSSYADARDAGRSPSEAFAYAVPQATAEYVGERLGGMGRLNQAFENAMTTGFARDAAWRELGRAFLAAGTKEVPSEELTYGLQFINDKFSPAGLQPNAGWEEFKSGAVDTAIVAMGTGGMMGGAGAVITAMQAPEPLRATDPVTAPIGIINAAKTTDEAIAAAAQALDEGSQSAEAVDNIGRILEQANVSTAPAVQPVDTGTAGGGRVDTAPGMDPGMGVDGAGGRSAVEPAGPADSPVGAAVPPGDADPLATLRDENAALRAQAIQALETQQIAAAPADAVPAARGDDTAAQLPPAGSAQVEAGGVAAQPQSAPGAAPTIGLPEIAPAQAPAAEPPVATAPAAPAADAIIENPAGSLPTPEQQRAAFAETEAKRAAKAGRLRSAAFDKNPLMAFLGKYGVSSRLASNFAPGTKERRKALVPGYGPVFRQAGLDLDALAERAAEEGYLPPGSRDARAMYDLIARAIRGERVIPQYAEGFVEKEAEAVTRARYEDFEDQFALDPTELEADIQAVADNPEEAAQIAALIAQAEAQGIDAESVLEEADRITENGTQEDYYAAAQQSLQNAIAQDAAGRRPGATERDAGGRPGQEAQPGRGGESRQGAGDARAEAGAQPTEGLTAPTRADIEAQQERAETAPARDQREQVRRESEAGAGLFELTQEDGRRDTTGNLFDQPEEKPAPATEKPVSQMSAADLLRAAADKMEGKSENIQDLGEKIGGARKDTAQPTGRAPRKKADTDDRPAWARRFQISEIVRAGGQIGEVRNEGRWVIRDTRSLDWMKQPKQVGRETFVSREAAEKALPLLAVAQKHRVVPVNVAGGEQAWEIWRDISDRKRVKVVDLQFGSRDDAMRYMAEHATEIIEANTTFGEADLPVPENKQRVGVERRQGDVKGEDFRSAFGFRGVEFGNWNNQAERQELMNEAYDGLMDLAEVMGVPPKAISLNGDLALAFGARGHGLSGARAHYEPDRAVMNLTKMKGAGALAHEWFHALDHYFGRQDGKAPVQWVTNTDGTRSLKTNSDFESNAVTSGFSRQNSGVRQEVREAYQALMETMMRKAEKYVQDTAKVEQFVSSVRDNVETRLAGIRRDLAEQKDVRYYKRNNKPASAEQLSEFDDIARQIIEGTALETELRPSGTKTLTGMRWSNDHLEKLSAIYKAVRGRSGFDAEQNGVLDRLRQEMGLYSARLKMLAEAQAGEEKTKKVPTDFAMDAKSLDQGRGTDYWITPHEMAARAFQGYVEDKIAERGGKSPFLNYAPENAGILTPWGAKRPYPAGAERQAINVAFDNLVDVIETRETEQGVAMYARGGVPDLLPVDDDTEALVQEYGEPVGSILDAERRHAAGERIFAMHEQDETISEITSVRQLKAWAPDQLVAVHRGVFEEAADQTETPAFRKWFGDSKVVDDQGKPLVVYHGTVADFSEFRTDSDLGAHFGSAEQANMMTARGKGEKTDRTGGNVKPIYLRITNPLRLADLGDFNPRNVVDQLNSLGIAPKDGSGFKPDHEYERMGADGVKALQAIIESHGYDGIVYLNRREGFDPFGPDGVDGDTLDAMSDEEVQEQFPEAQDSYIAFRPEQIKSATGNRGTFDPSSSDITMARGMDAAAFRRAFGAPEPMDVGRTQEIVDELTSAWENGPTIKVVARAADLPGGNHPRDARGLIQNGTAYIVAANNPTRDAVARTLGHEAIGHYGLWKMLGTDGTTQFQRNLQLALKTGNKPLAKIRDKVRRLYVDDRGRFNLTPAQEADEIAAFAVEQAIDPMTGEFRPGFGFLKSVWAKIADFLRGLGLKVRFTNAELQGLLVQSMRGLQVGQRLEGGADMLVAAARDQSPEGKALQALSENDELFALPKSDKATVEEIAADNDPDIKVRKTKIGSETLYTLTMPGGDDAKLWVRPANPYGEQIYSMDLVDGDTSNVETGRPGENPEDVDPAVEDVYLDVSNLKPGASGNTLYNIAATFAHNTGRIFIGDPSGLSDSAMRRRLENMISTALKFGTTDHIAPHPRQVKGDAKIGVPPLKWVYGDSLGNIRRMIDISLKAEETGDLPKYVYDPATGNLSPAETGGRPVAEKPGPAGGGVSDVSGAPAQRGRTGARAAIFRALLRETGGEAQGSARGRDGLLAGLVSVANQFPGAAKGIFYARGAAAGQPGVTPLSSTSPTNRQPNAVQRGLGYTSVDAGGRAQFTPGAWLNDKIGDLAGPMLAKLGLKAASPELRRMLRQMKLEVERAKEIAAAVAGEATKLSDAERAMVSDLVEKELKAGTIPPVHAVRLAAVINDAMGKQTDELIRLGMLSPDTAEKWRDQYLPRYYESKLGKTIKDVWADSIGKMFRQPSAMKGIRGKHLKGRGLYQTIPESQLADFEALGWEVRDPDYQAGLTGDGTVQVWRDFTRQERDAMGEIRDAGFRFVMGYMQTQKDIALGRLFEALAANPEMSSRTETQKFSAQVPDSKVSGTGAKVYGRLAGRWVSPETLSQLSRAEEEGNEALRVYRKAMSYWKQSKTVLNPVAHANNIISNVTMAHFAGVSYWRPDAYMGAIRDLVKKDVMVKEAKDAGLFLGTMSSEELMNTMPEQLRVLAGKQESAAEKAGMTVWNMMSFWLSKPMGAAYQAEDTFFRYLLYRDARQRGVEPQDAVDYAQKYIFTYDDLPKGARRIRDFGLPFFAYTYKAIPALLNTALTHPERMAAPAVVLMVANTMAYAIAAGDDEDDLATVLRRYLNDAEFREKVREKEKFERKLLPDWNKGYTALMTPKVIRLGNDEVTGLPLFLDMSRMMPGGDLFDVNPNAGGIPLPQPITPSHPMITLTVGMLANKDLFRGTDLTDSNDTSAEKAEKRVDWMWKQLTPAIAVNNYHWERTMNALAQANGGEVRYIPDILGGDSTGTGRDGLPVQSKYAVMQTFGIKARPIDLETSELIQLSQQKKMVRDIDAEIRRLKRLSGKGAISERTLEKELDAAIEKKMRVREGLTVDGEEK